MKQMHNEQNGLADYALLLRQFLNCKYAILKITWQLFNGAECITAKTRPRHAHDVFWCGGIEEGTKPISNRFLLRQSGLSDCIKAANITAEKKPITQAEQASDRFQIRQQNLNLTAMHRTLLLHATLLLLTQQWRGSEAAIPSFGLQTVQSVREKLPDSAFLIRPSKLRKTQTDSLLLKATDVVNYPALGAPDVQATIVYFTVFSGRSLFEHSHPRAAEVYHLLEGRLKFTMRFEGGTRNVTNYIQGGQSTIVPQGLLHTATCISKSNCNAIATFNSADPGSVPV